MFTEKSKVASTTVPIHSHLANRWSPRGFDAGHDISNEQLLALLEAARWTPSCSNTQPWRFIVGRRGDATFEHIVENLKSYNKEWTPFASVLMVVCAQLIDDDGKPQRWAEYDTGQAIATLTMQASELGLYVHQMAGFEVDGIRTTFDLPTELTPVTAVAVGMFDPEAELPEVLAERERATRERLDVVELVLNDLNLR